MLANWEKTLKTKLFSTEKNPKIATFTIIKESVQVQVNVFNQNSLRSKRLPMNSCKYRKNHDVQMEIQLASRTNEYVPNEG